jgi:hypothetical protein
VLPGKLVDQRAPCAPKRNADDARALELAQPKRPRPPAVGFVPT